ncbi:GrpB family protein [Undibacterium sp. Di27W]
MPGLAAKPVIDVLLGASSLTDIEAKIEVLEDQGYL